MCKLNEKKKLPAWSAAKPRLDTAHVALRNRLRKARHTAKRGAHKRELAYTRAESRIAKQPVDTELIEAGCGAETL